MAWRPCSITPVGPTATSSSSLTLPSSELLKTWMKVGGLNKSCNRCTFILYYIILYDIILYCIVLYCIVFYCIIL